MVLGVGAAVGELAPWRERREARNAPGDRLQPLSAPLARRDCGQERLRIRVQRPLEERDDVGLLDGTAGVHDHDPVADLRDDAEVVRDEENGRAVLSRSSRRSSIICASSVTSSADVASSAMRSAGSSMSAIAIMIRCRIPLRTGAGSRRAAPGVGDADLLEHRDRAPRIARRSPASRRCARRTSIIWVPIVKVGFRLESGSWKIIASSLPRRRRSCSAVEAEHVLAHRRCGRR